jgi:hypothetical protein
MIHHDKDPSPEIEGRNFHHEGEVKRILMSVGVMKELDLTRVSHVCVYYETIKRKIKRRLIHECRCDERLTAKA